MSQLRPLLVPGATYFFTVRLKDPTSKLLISQVDLLRQAVRACRQQMPFHIGSSVVLPNRMHTIWTLPPGDDDYGKRWKMIKTTFARHAQVPRRAVTNGLWQRRYWEVPVLAQGELDEYEAMIWHAAVSEGLVKRPEDWPYCTISRARTWDAELVE
ncbi:transposase [Yoonia sp. R2331]|uniref:REP-associated tyrosine transposase n=1 Tax=Yoonia sp. R2331 TaxID=3237238 RepID=UPI0034E5B1A1